jgi:hypothetical protein
LSTVPPPVGVTVVMNATTDTPALKASVERPSRTLAGPLTFVVLLWIYALVLGALTLAAVPVIDALASPDTRLTWQVAVGAVVSVVGGSAFLPLLAALYERRHCASH